MYLSTVTVATLGYGDYHAVTRGEMIFSIIFVLYILGFTSYIIGNFTNLIVESTNKTRKFVSVYMGICVFLEYKMHVLDETYTSEILVSFLGS